MPSPWRPTIVQREHPFGEAGVRSSLEEVAKAIARGSIDPRVRTWAVNTLSKARDEGARVDNNRGRAEVLLKAVQKKLWVPDPVGAEYIPEAHLLACDETTPDAVCVKGDDCDGVASLLGSAFMSVGLYALVVGHGYKKNVIQHVLCAVRVDGRWEYADPSTALPLGHCHDFQRERILSVPNVKVLCDANSCIRVDPAKWDPELSGFVEKGVFVGVREVPTSPVKIAWIVERPESGTLGISVKESWEAYRNGARGIGAAGGAALCVATGAGTVVASLCAVIGAEIAEFITSMRATGTFFLSDPKAEAAARTALDDARRTVGRILTVAVLELQRKYSGLSVHDAAVALSNAGLQPPPWVLQPGGDVPRCFPISGVPFCAAPTDLLAVPPTVGGRGLVKVVTIQKGSSKATGPKFQPADFDANMTDLQNYADTIMVATIQADIALSAPPTIRPMILTTAPKKSAAPVVVGTAAVGLLAWWLLA